VSVYTGPERRVRDVPVARERRKGPGRPPLVEGERGDRITVTLPIALNEHLCILSIRTGKSVSAIIREAVERAFQIPTI
jgi:hypothetical protein